MEKTLKNELKQGEELAKELMKHLNPTTSSVETGQFLIEKILSTYEKALSMLNCSTHANTDFGVEQKPFCSVENSSPKSVVSDLNFKDSLNDGQDVICKKRKSPPKWTEQVRVRSGTGPDGPVDDGYSWRKYGQKEILGAKFPRGYYRCTHRHTQGCLAIKQVQKSDTDPTIYEVTYKGRHTCIQSSRFGMPLLKNPNQTKKQKVRPNKNPTNTEYAPNIRVEDFDSKDNIFPSFSFQFTPNGCEIDNNNIFESMFENDLLGNLSPTLISPATSESKYFPMSPCYVSNNFDYDIRTPESEILSRPTSVTNSPVGDFEIPIENVELDPNFPFNHPEFFL